MPRQRRNGEGGVYYEPGRRRWRVDITLPDGQPKHVGRFKTEKEALKAKADALRDAQQGTIATGPRQTVAQWFDHWLEEVIRPNRAQGTYRTYRDKVRLHILPELGRLQVTAVTADHLQRMYAKKNREGLAGATIAMIHVGHVRLSQTGPAPWVCWPQRCRRCRPATTQSSRWDRTSAHRRANRETAQRHARSSV
jgi:hypothetical protein